jgi:hypothetical protein
MLWLSDRLRPLFVSKMYRGGFLGQNLPYSLTSLMQGEYFLAAKKMTFVVGPNKHTCLFTDETKAVNLTLLGGRDALSTQGSATGSRDHTSHYEDLTILGEDRAFHIVSKLPAIGIPAFCAMEQGRCTGGFRYASGQRK